MENNQHAGDGATEVATFAGGCFWCTEAAFKALDGVLSVVSGYTGGSVKNPTYEQVSTGTTGHFEAVRIVYDPARISYEQLLERFWQGIDPTDATGQFSDHGPQYRTAIFYHSDAQKEQAERSKHALEQASGTTVATLILPAAPFYKAEDYHQDYYRKNPLRYQLYKKGSGRG